MWFYPGATFFSLQALVKKELVADGIRTLELKATMEPRRQLPLKLSIV